MSQLPTGGRVAGGAVAKVRDFRSTLLCVAILLVCVLVSHPVAETGMGDDFAYIWAAKVLAATGHVVYTGAATAMLTWQLYLGALFIKIFGFSFTVVRASVTLVSLRSTAMLHRIFLRRSEEHTSELQSLRHLVCRLLLEKKRAIGQLSYLNLVLPCSTSAHTKSTAY